MRTSCTARVAILLLGCGISLPLLQAQTPDLGQSRQPRSKTPANHGTQERHKRGVPPPVSLANIPLSAPLAQLDFVPSGPVLINYQDGQLTINAFNTPIGDVLRQVCNHFGASVELPPGANDRVFGQIGPGPARDVIASLLHGVDFNYVIQVSAADPNRLARVILSPKPLPLPAGGKARQ